ncbi:MAG: ABC transporter ATP-binding protein, partial [Acidobacteriota bacterium]
MPERTDPGAGPDVDAVDLWKSYRDGERQVDVLRGASLRLWPGEMVAVVGPSGSGKSTLLHLLGALDLPDRGEVKLAGRDLGKAKRRELARLRNEKLGFVFQFHRLLPDFDALENVCMPGRIAGRPLRDVVDRARSLLVEVGLEDRLDHFPSQLSGGERQRVALCRALVMEPRVLLADEPTGNLDPSSAETVFQLLLELQESHGTTTVLVTHNPALAERCGRIVQLDDGVLAP